MAEFQLIYVDLKCPIFLLSPFCGGVNGSPTHIVTALQEFVSNNNGNVGA